MRIVIPRLHSAPVAAVMDDPIALLHHHLYPEARPARGSADPVTRWFAVVSKGVMDLGPWTLNDLREPVADPWRLMIVARKPESAVLAWRIAAAGLLGTASGPGGAWLLIDGSCDVSGRHRVYRADAKGKALTPVFEDVADLARWALDGVVRGAVLETLPTLRADTWSAHPNSVDRLWGPLGVLHPAGMYKAWRAKTSLPAAPPPGSFDPEAPGAVRAAVHWTLANFVNARDVAVPPGLQRGRVSALHGTLLDRLNELRVAMERNEVPPLVADLALDDDEALSAAAMDWMLRYDRAREPGAVTPPVPDATSAVLRSLRAALEGLRKREVLDIPKGKVKPLADDLFEAALAAPTPRTIPKILVDALLESKHVEEVYADDAELTEAFTKALGL